MKTADNLFDKHRLEGLRLTRGRRIAPPNLVRVPGYRVQDSQIADDVISCGRRR